MGKEKWDQVFDDVSLVCSSVICLCDYLISYEGKGSIRLSKILNQATECPEKVVDIVD